MSKNVTNPLQELNNLGVELLEPYINAKTSTLFKCKKCGCEFMNTLTSIKQSYKKYNSNGCKACAIIGNRLKRLQNSVEFLNKHGLILNEEYKGALQQHKMKCSTCNNVFTAIPSVKVEQAKRGKIPCDVCSKNKHGINTNTSMMLKLKQIGLTSLGQTHHDPEMFNLQCISCKHEFTANPVAKIRSSKRRNSTLACPNCIKIQNKKHYNEKQTNIEINEKLFEIGLELAQDFSNVKKHHDLKCLLCSNIFTATPLAKIQAFKKHKIRGCPTCTSNQRYKDVRERNITLLRNRGIEILDSAYNGSHGTCNDKVFVKNTKCGHKFYVSTINLLQAKVECAICGPIKRIQAATAWSKSNSQTWRETASEWKRYKSEVMSLTNETYKKHKHIINPNQFERGAAGNQGAYQLDHIVPIRFCFEQNIPPNIAAHVDNLQMLPWETNVCSSDCIKGSFPSIFYEFIDSDIKASFYTERLIGAFPDFATNVNVHGNIATLSKIDGGFSIFVVPISKSHSNQKIAHNIHLNMQKHSVPNIIVFEDELNEKFDIVVSKIKHRLLTNNVPSIYARNCEIKQIHDRKVYGEFLNANHIQGKGPANVAYGAFFKEKLVAVMLFSHPRTAVGNKNEHRDSWELVRFATSLECRIPGIATKLLQTFKNNHIWKEIYTYVDKRTSTSLTYERMGMVKIRESEPSSYYVKNGKRRSAWAFTKERLRSMLDNYNEEFTDFQNLTDAGYWRVWDAGHMKYMIVNENYFNHHKTR